MDHQSVNRTVHSERILKHVEESDDICYDLLAAATAKNHLQESAV